MLLLYHNNYVIGTIYRPSTSPTEEDSRVTFAIHNNNGNFIIRYNHQDVFPGVSPDLSFRYIVFRLI